MLSLFQIKQILHPVTETLPTDDFRILDSWAEYDENSSKDPEKRKQIKLGRMPEIKEWADLM